MDQYALDYQDFTSHLRVMVCGTGGSILAICSTNSSGAKQFGYVRVQLHFDASFYACHAHQFYFGILGNDANCIIIVKKGLCISPSYLRPCLVFIPHTLCDFDHR